MSSPGRSLVAHLVRRAVGSASNAPASESQRDLVRAVLTATEFEMWERMPGRDQCHSVQVLARFDVLVPGAPRCARAAALLHDVGKLESGLGWTMRIVATVVGPRGKRFAAYHDHERIGADMLRSVSEPETVALVAGQGGDERVREALRAADDL